MDTGVVKKITTSLALYAFSHLVLLLTLLYVISREINDINYRGLTLLIPLILYLPYIPLVMFFEMGYRLFAFGAVLSYLLGFVAFLRAARVEPRLRTLRLGAKVLTFAYLASAVPWALVVLGILAYAVRLIEYFQWIALSQVWQVPFLAALGALHFAYLCGLVLFAVGLYRLGEELGGGFNAKLVRVGAVVLVPLGFVGAALAYAGLRGRL